MPCTRIPNGIVCTSSGPSVDLKPYGSNVRMDFDKRFGPLFYRKNGSEIITPSPKTWAAFGEWWMEAGRRDVRAAR
jgi:hypothetical protein